MPGRLKTDPERRAELGLHGGVATIIFALLVVVISIVLAVLLAFVTYALGDLVARALVGPAPEFSLALREPASPSQQG